ncbi:MAG: hypothetical protein WC142_09845 [Bacteroidales bacterium]|jgi:hypothetical protein|nr:hypothetical protein [Bacteroidales bacterium]
MKKITLIMSFIFIFVSCEKFPKNDELIGSWVEQTDNTFKCKLIFEDEIVYLFKSSKIDTLSYWLDKKQKRIFFNYPSGASSFKINLNKRDKELTIWGLYMSIPEKPSETVFRKEE